MVDPHEFVALHDLLCVLIYSYVFSSMKFSFKFLLIIIKQNILRVYIPNPSEIKFFFNCFFMAYKIIQCFYI